MKKLLLRNLMILTVISSLLFSCQKDISKEQKMVVNASMQNNSSLVKYNPFGVIVLASAVNQNVNNTSNPAKQYQLSAQNSINLAVDYGVKFYRMQIYNDKWLDSTSRRGFLYVYSQANLAGLKVLLNVSYYNSDAIPEPFVTGAQYGVFLKSVLDTLNALKIKPELIVVDNEEANKNRHLFDFTSTATIQQSQQLYIDQLSVATTMCNSYLWWDGATGVKVTNGGFTTRGITYNVWDWLRNEKKDSLAAVTFAKNAFPPKTYAALIKKTTPLFITTAVDMGKYYINAFQSIPMSVVNLHWYEPCIMRGWDSTKEGTTPKALGISEDSMSVGVLDQVLAYLTEKFPQKIVGQEVGQLTTSPVLNKQMTSKFLKRQYGAFDYACWYDGDSNTPYEAKALHNTSIKNGIDSYTKRNSGLKFEETNTSLNTFK